MNPWTSRNISYVQYHFNRFICFIYNGPYSMVHTVWFKRYVINDIVDAANARSIWYELYWQTLIERIKFLFFYMLFLWNNWTQIYIPVDLIHCQLKFNSLKVFVTMLMTEADHGHQIFIWSEPSYSPWWRKEQKINTYIDFD